MTDWIQGEKFQQIANYTYTSANSVGCNDFELFIHTLDVSLLKDDDIIFTQGAERYKRELLNLIEGNKRVVLISHNHDDCIDETYRIPDNVIKWYSPNINAFDPRLESIPRGLQNDIWFSHRSPLRAAFNITSEPINKIDRMISKLAEPKNISNLVYMDHRIYSNIAERVLPYKILGDKSYVTSITEHTYDIDLMNAGIFDKYIDGVYNHSFVICPPGNAIDTHRPWEALYLKSIPIVKRSINSSYYEDLPICVIDDWEEVTENFLLNWLDMSKAISWNMEKLNFSYWKNKILNTR